MKFTEKDIKTFKNISLIAGVFTAVIAIMMIFSLLQLKIMNPLENPTLITLMEQFDRDPDNMDKAEQVRALDLMARKAYFSSRWQVETGAYLLLFGALIFIIFQRLVAGAEKATRKLYPDKPNIAVERTQNSKYLLISAAAVTFVAIVSSFILKNEIPAPGRKISASSDQAESTNAANAALLTQIGEVNFPFFRGERNNGLAGGSGYPTEWNGKSGKNIKWKIQSPKAGQSSPVIWGNKLFITGVGDGELGVWCIDKNTGEILWEGSGRNFPNSSAADPEVDEETGMAASTPAVNDNFVFAMFGNGNVVCFDHNGTFIWGKNVGVPASTYGYSGSLLIYENILIIQYDSRDKISMIGLDVATGDTKWETPRTGRSVNTSPALAVFDGVVQIIVNGNPNVTAFDPLTGRELWSMQGVSGDVAVSAAINSTTVYVSSEYFKLLALRPGRSARVAWEHNAYTPGLPSPVANEDFLFLAVDYGDIVCYNAQTGELLWEEVFNSHFYSSPILSDGKVWLLDRTGKMYVVEASGAYNLIALNELDESVDTTPAFSESRIYIRGKHNIYCIATD